MAGMCGSMIVRPAGLAGLRRVEHAADFAPGPAEPGGDGARWYRQRRGDLLVAQAAERDQQQHVPVVVAELRERAQQRLAARLRADPGRNPLVVSARVWLHRSTGEGPVAACLRPPVLRHQPGRYPEQPRPDGAAGGIERSAPAEGVDERFRGKVVGVVGSQTAGDVAVDAGEMQVIDVTEPFRLPQRLGQHRGVVADRIGLLAAGRARAGRRAHQSAQRTEEPGLLPARPRRPAHEDGPATGDPPGWVTHTHTRAEPQTFFTPARYLPGSARWRRARRSGGTGRRLRHGRPVPGTWTGRARISPVRGPVESRSRLAGAPSAMRHSAVQMKSVRRSGPPSISANGARFSWSSTRCRILPPSATRATENPPLDTHTAPSASMQMPSGPRPSANTRRPDSPPPSPMANAVSRPANDSEMISVPPSGVMIMPLGNWMSPATWRICPSGVMSLM